MPSEKPYTTVSSNNIEDIPAQVRIEGQICSQAIRNSANLHNEVQGGETKIYPTAFQPLYFSAGGLIKSSPSLRPHLSSGQSETH